jgi:hypothetical protein
MNEQEIIEGNKLIAEFINLPFKTYGKTGKTYYINGKPFSIPNLKYHSDWNCLMEVVEKIQHMEDDLPVKIDFQIYLLGAVELWIDHKRIFAMTAFEPGTLINAVYNGIIEFIKWYNTLEK